MKYLKFFENINNGEVWIVIKISSLTPNIDDLEIFYDEESAKNYYITEVNESAKEDKNIKEDTIFTLQDAEEYIDNNNCLIEYFKVVINDKYELPENLVIGKDTKKFNM